MQSFALYLTLFHIFCVSPVIASRIKSTAQRLKYVEGRLEAEGRIRRNNFNSLNKKLERMETMLQKILDDKDKTSLSADTESSQKQHGLISDEKVKTILNAFQVEKVQNYRFRREITRDLNKQFGLKIHALENEEKKLDDIATLIRLVREEVENHELGTKETLEQLRQIAEENAQTLNLAVNTTRKASENSSINFLEIRESLKEQSGTINKLLQTTGHDDSACLNGTQPFANETITAKPSQKYKSCLELYRNGFMENGVYEIWLGTVPTTKTVLSVYCDMSSDDGGWTVFQRRKDGSVDFFREWTDYKYGFGDLQGEFWLGNEYINLLTNDGEIHELRIDMEDYYGNQIFVKYSQFQVSSESTNYTLDVSGYTGDAGDSLNDKDPDFVHNGMQFTTKDRDNDKYTQNCAEHGNGAWWYNSCFASNLNGIYVKQIECNSVRRCIAWRTWGSHNKNLKFTEMKFR